MTSVCGVQAPPVLADRRWSADADGARARRVRMSCSTCHQSKRSMHKLRFLVCTRSVHPSRSTVGCLPIFFFAHVVCGAWASRSTRATRRAAGPITQSPNLVCTWASAARHSATRVRADRPAAFQTLTTTTRRSASDSPCHLRRHTTVGRAERRCPWLLGRWPLST